MTMLGDAIALVKYEPEEAEKGSFQVSESTFGIYTVHIEDKAHTFEKGCHVALMPDAELSNVAYGSQQVFITSHKSIAAIL